MSESLAKPPCVYCNQKILRKEAFIACQSCRSHLHFVMPTNLTKIIVNPIYFIALCEAFLPFYNSVFEQPALAM